MPAHSGLPGATRKHRRRRSEGLLDAAAARWQAGPACRLGSAGGSRASGPTKARRSGRPRRSTALSAIPPSRCVQVRQFKSAWTSTIAVGELIVDGGCVVALPCPFGPEKLSVNQMTLKQMPTLEFLEECARQQVRWVGLWRESVADTGVSVVCRRLRTLGIQVSSLCRAGFFPESDSGAVERRRQDNLEILEMAATVGAETVIVVSGAAADRDLVRAREVVREGFAQLVEAGASMGVRLALEPLHPMQCAERSVVVTLEQALGLVRPLSTVWSGLTVDAYNVWWDPELSASLSAAQGRVFCVQLSDWVVPTVHLLNDRGLMGEGVIEITKLVRAVLSGGYSGAIEVEVFSERLWRMPGTELLSMVRRQFDAIICDLLDEVT